MDGNCCLPNLEEELLRSRCDPQVRLGLARVRLENRALGLSSTSAL